jgi:sulfate adenylyltransferase
MEKNNHRGAVVFFTGLSGSGKSTIAQTLVKLLEKQERSVTLLDGDVVRQHLSNELGFSREDRNTNIRRIGFVAGEIVKHGGIAICAAIAPYQESRDRNRQLIEKTGTYLEIFVKAPLSVCEQRDTKGLYKKARAGFLKNFTGIDDPYEEPKNADLVIETTKMLPEEAAEEVYEILMSREIISTQV